MNENYAQPSLPLEAREGVIRGMYRYAIRGSSPAIRLLGSGAILREVIAAAEWLEREMKIASEIWSVTSYSELAREAGERERSRRLTLPASPSPSHLETCLSGNAPIVAASDYVRAVPQMLASYLPGRRFIVLGTDGFGRSDTRAALRQFFEVDRSSIALAAIQALVETDRLPQTSLAEAALRLGVSSSEPPWTR
jgi:pyruvate dehydrogenase E1 component